jgi:hypothetical protein
MLLARCETPILAGKIANLREIYFISGADLIHRQYDDFESCFASLGTFPTICKLTSKVKSRQRFDDKRIIMYNVGPVDRIRI